MNDDTDDYFCVGADGVLWVLGNHGDFDAAEATAASLGVTPVWTFGRETAHEWQAVLNHHLPPT